MLASVMTRLKIVLSTLVKVTEKVFESENNLKNANEHLFIIWSLTVVLGILYFHFNVNEQFLLSVSKNFCLKP